MLFYKTALYYLQFCINNIELYFYFFTLNALSEFIIAKHRAGPQATIQLLFKKDTSTFLNMSKNEIEEE